MPNRILREGILSSEAVCGLGWAAEVFYRRLMSVADDHGRFYASPKLLRAACYPLQIDKVSDADIGKWISECETAALVSVYPALDGKRYVQIMKFGQQLRSKSKYPEPIDGDRKPLLAIASKCEQPIADAHLGVSVSVVGISEEANASSSSAEPTVRPPKLPPCPFAEIVKVYHEVLPELPGVRVMDDERKRVLSKFWTFILTSKKTDGSKRADSSESALAWLRGYFEHARQNDFVMGRTARTAEHANWKASLDYLCTSRGLKQVIEKTVEQAA